MAGGWRRLHNEELRNLYASLNIIRVIISRRMGMRGMTNAYNISVGKPGSKIPLGRPRYRWEDNIRIDLMEIQWKGLDWIYLGQDRNQW
jgi:hypothetical protein